MSQAITPLDPDSDRGRAVAERLTRTLAEIRVAVERRRREAARVPAAA